jgi:hypothetical protein
MPARASGQVSFVLSLDMTMQIRCRTINLGGEDPSLVGTMIANVSDFTIRSEEHDPAPLVQIGEPVDAAAARKR